jgi:hypothetical protein
MEEEIKLPTVKVEDATDSPVTQVKPEELRTLGQRLSKTFTQYSADRKLMEEKWLRNLRQYLGIYDPEIERELASTRSKAYPRITRVKCISVVSRVMNLMFPGNEQNWELRASPSPDMNPMEVQQAVMAEMQKMQAAGMQPQVDDEMVRIAVQELADERAKGLSRLIDDQLQELGGDQTADYVSLNRKVVQSGVLYGLGVVRGPFVREQDRTTWVMDEATKQPSPMVTTDYRPQFEFLPVWDYYPDMSAKNLHDGDGYFVRLVMSKQQLRKLANRSDFFEKVIKQYIGNKPRGNYKAKTFETELRTMGTKANVNDETATEDGKYEVLVWHGPVSANRLMEAGVDVADSKKADDVDAEIWLLGDHVIKAEMNPWKKLGVDVRTIHTFLFDEDDTSPVGNGLPNIMRDSQMSISAATRMLLDNASVVCGPNLEVNTDLVRADQDIQSVQPYKIWYREGVGAEAAQPAVRNVAIDAHMQELLSTIQLFNSFADTETFVGAATGGDMERGYSEPMRTAAGASMLRGDAALPFKDIIRNFDQFTRSVITSLVMFNRKFNPGKTPEGDYNVIARGATSLIAKEVRGMQVDQLAATLTPEERIHVDARKLVEARLGVRDMGNLLLSEPEVERRQAAAQQEQQQKLDLERETARAEIRKTLSDAMKNIAQGQKNLANADATTLKAAMQIVETGLEQLDAVAEPEMGQQQNPQAPAGIAAFPAGPIG